MMGRSEDPVNHAILPIFRYFLNAFLSPQTQGWRLGFATAVGTWGDARGLAIANAAQNFIAAVLRGRPVPIKYHDPLNLDQRTHTTTDEKELLAIIKHMRNDDTAQARDAISRLTHGQVKANIVREGLVLASHFQATGSLQKLRKPITLRAVS